METGTFERTELPSGLRVLTERMPTVRSVTLGIWAGVGSRDETPRLAGASHYLEHLLFKGTKRRSARDIAELMDAVGGEANAFTAKEYTCFYARTLDRELPLAFDVLVDMLRFSKLTKADVEAERTVILEEIGMHNDAPDDIVHDLFAEVLLGGHPLGRPVLGTVASIGAMTRDSVARYWRRHYVPSNLVVAAAGNCSHDDVVELVAAAFEGAGGGRLTPHPGQREPRLHRGVQVRRKPTEQAHVVLGTRGMSRSDPRRFALGVLNIAFGGAMSSRLFQEVLGLEDTSGRMTRLGKSELTSGEILSVDEIVRRVDEVTDEDVRAVAKEVLGSGPRALALIGPFDEEGFDRYLT